MLWNVPLICTFTRGTARRLLVVGQRQLVSRRRLPGEARLAFLPRVVGGCRREIGKYSVYDFVIPTVSSHDWLRLVSFCAQQRSGLLGEFPDQQPEPRVRGFEIHGEAVAP
jgi:hypothetical protein